MGIKICAAGLCLAVVAAMPIVAVPVEAQTTRREYVYTTRAVPPVNRPRARVTVEPRSFLDAGTEVLPGERKFTDYAFPAGSYSMPLSAVTNTGVTRAGQTEGLFSLWAGGEMPRRGKPICDISWIEIPQCSVFT